VTESPSTPPGPGRSVWAERWQRFSAAALRGYHAYGNWLISISWRRFILLAAALLIVVAIVHDMPPFTWTITEQVQEHPRIPRPPKPPKPPRVEREGTPPAVHIETPKPGDDVEIKIGKDGIRIGPRKPADAAASAAESAADAAAHARSAADAAASAVGDIRIQVPPGVANEAVREAIAQARAEIEAAVREAREEAEAAAREAAEAKRDAEAVYEELSRQPFEGPVTRNRVRRVGIGDALMQLTLLWIVASAILKFTYKGRVQAEVKAAQAAETAEAESLKRQVVEARMAAMQAQVEPHFLFNTLASIDHLIETDPGRASQMQKNLIALLRASMPSMREATGAQGNGQSGVRELGRELAVIRPYLEILKVRMEERLAVDLQVPDGLLSAEFPPMMIQTLVENAIKHGLEPKAEGGALSVKAEIVHGKLQVTVADTGLGFGKAATAGTGVGLANIRERLQLLYGTRASLTVAENQPSGTVVTITVPYRTVEGAVA
jgi:signal transduction histidine kinase